MSLFRAAAIGIPLLLSGCAAYDPPVQGDRASPRFKSDMEACRTTAQHTVYLHNAGTLFRWIISPITGPGMVRAEIRRCMNGKGYASLPSAS